MYLSCGCEILPHQPSIRDTPLEEQCTPHLPEGSQGVAAYRPPHCRCVAGGHPFSHFTCAMFQQQTHFLITATAVDPVQWLSRSRLVSHLAVKKKSPGHPSNACRDGLVVESSVRAANRSFSPTIVHHLSGPCAQPSATSYAVAPPPNPL